MREDLIENERWNIVGSNVVAKGKRRISEYEDVKTFNFDFPTGVNKSEIDLWDIIDYGETDYFMKQESADKIVARLDSETMQASYSQPVILHNIYGGFKEKKPRVFLNYSPTIRTSKGGGHIPSWLIPEQHTSGAFTLRIRKLSPLECFKLQGLSEEDFDKLKATGLSDTQLYKMAGNAVSIPVIEHIGLKIKELLKHNLIKE